jgi:lipid II:glycine glycyltransferase (peptidoglycan interpeptide bridge formation enzyme)
VYLQYVSERGTEGIALGLRLRSRISKAYYFPSLPALNGCDLPNQALLELMDCLRKGGTSFLRFGSSEANWLPDPSIPTNGWPRLEYTVDISIDPEELMKSFGSTHRRHLRRGIREGWQLCQLEGEEAVDLLHDVRTLASDRAVERGDGFAVRDPMESLAEQSEDLNADWGVRTFAVCDGDEPLAAALVGWAGRRVYFVAGGSTPEGYRRSAAVWLHWSIMREFAEQGFLIYNLGGTPEAAEEPDHPAHGLYRFKKGFGPQMARRRGAHLVSSPMRVRAHQLLRSLKQALSV